MRRFFAGALLVLASCGGAEQDIFAPSPSAASAAHAGHAGASDAGASGGSGEDDREAVGGSAGSSAGAQAELGGASGAGGAGEAGAGGALEICNSEAEDVPDDEFIDTNCDGIDGDASRAVFVAPAGADINTGRLDAPVRTLKRGLELAVKQKVPIYVCTATYAENVVIETPLAIYGGYDCERGWRRSKDLAEIAPASGLALSIQYAGGAVYLERLAFRAAPGRAARETSQAAAIHGSKDVTVKRVEFEARAGADGEHGVAGAELEAPRDFAGGQGSAASDCVPRRGEHGTGCLDYPKGGYDASAVVTCTYQGQKYQTRGGRGGYGGNPRLDTEDACMALSPGCGEVGWPGEYKIGNGAWKRLPWQSTWKEDTCLVSRFSPGAAPGKDGADGASATSSVGTLMSGRYVATNGGEPGADGEPGSPGHGGDGVTTYSGWNDVLCASDYAVGDGGGQGGPGGCGGRPGSAGGAGGGSIALGIDSSHVSLIMSRLITGQGGRGGDGAPGGFGQQFFDVDPATSELTPVMGAPRPGDGGPYGKAGQWGGRGGRGGDGGAGAGGPSIGIAYVGEAPELDASSFAIGLPGRGGVSQSNATGRSGLSGNVYRFDLEEK